MLKGLLIFLCFISQVIIIITAINNWPAWIAFLSGAMLAVGAFGLGQTLK